MPAGKLAHFLLASHLLTAIIACGTPAQAAEKPPNVLIILTDDQGYGDLSCHGNPALRTPNIDRLHDQSLRFNDFHSAPMCTPTRGQLMTGLDALRNGATSVTAGRSFLRPGLTTMPQLFAAAGYKTGLFGKWHLGDSYPHRPMDKGFQESVYHLGWGFTSAPEFSNTLFDGRYLDNGKPKQFEGYVTDFWFNRAMAWMKQRQEANQPFLCYLPTNAPHTPHIVGQQYSDPYQGRGPAAFFGMIANIDENMGRLESFLQETGLRDNTILIWMTDNGGTAGVKLHNAGMRGHKTEYYEGGHRVPCFVRWPAGRLLDPRDIPTTSQMQDILPTLLDLCKIVPPASVRLDGKSLAPLLQEASAKLDDRILVVQYGQIPAKWDSAVLWNRWRLVKGAELYNLDTDPGQQHDVASQHPEILKKLRDHYEAWWADIVPTLDDFVPIALGATQQPVVELTSSDWESVYADNAGHVRNAAGGPRGGPWNVVVERPGTYQIEVRRWPPDTGWALASSGDEQGKPLPIAAARVQIAGTEMAAAVDGTQPAARFRLDLPAGRTQLHAWFQDAAGNNLSGAFYALVSRLPQP
jgi:arylsulfatase